MLKNKYNLLACLLIALAFATPVFAANYTDSSTASGSTGSPTELVDVNVYVYLNELRLYNTSGNTNITKTFKVTLVRNGDATQILNLDLVNTSNNVAHYAINGQYPVPSDGWAVKIVGTCYGAETNATTTCYSSTTQPKSLYNPSRFDVKDNNVQSGLQWVALKGQVIRPQPGAAKNTGGTTGADSDTEPANTSGYRLFPTATCGANTLTCFTQQVFVFAQGAIIVLAVGAIVAAGIIYMTSGGNPKQIEMAKKLIFGALTAVAVMVLGRLFLTQVVGVAWPSTL
jgi:hypothetical protein